MACPDTVRFELNKGKRIGQVLFIIEGLDTEANLIYRVFSKILGYQMERLYRNGNYRVFHRTDDPYSKITVINTAESNIKFIDKDDEFLNRMFDTLIEDYNFDLDNAAIYYIFDRDPKSNTDQAFIRNSIGKLSSSREINVDWGRQGMLLLSYPCIESFVGMNLLSNSLEYCWNRHVAIGEELKPALDQDGLIPNKINEATLIHCVEELYQSLDKIGLESTVDTFIDDPALFASNNRNVYDWQELIFDQKGQYGLLSLFIVALLDLGLIRIENCVSQ